MADGIKEKRTIQLTTIENVLHFIFCTYHILSLFTMHLDDGFFKRVYTTGCLKSNKSLFFKYINNFSYIHVVNFN